MSERILFQLITADGIKSPIQETASNGLGHSLKLVIHSRIKAGDIFEHSDLTKTDQGKPVVNCRSYEMEKVEVVRFVTMRERA